MCQDVVAADDAVDNKSRSRERPYDTPAAHCGQSRGRHGLGGDDDAANFGMSVGGNGETVVAAIF